MKKINQRSVSLDLARSIAISFVVLGHIFQKIGSPAGNFFGIPNFYYISIGGLGVTVFLILSGISLEMSNLNKKKSYKNFLLGRILRIYPTYYITLIFGIFFYLYFNNFTLPNFNFTHILASLTATYAFIGKWGGPFVPTSWFIGLIMSLYLVYPLLSRLIKAKPILTIFVLLIISTITRLIMGAYYYNLERPIDWFILSRIFEFGLGIFLVYYCKNTIWSSMNKFKTLGSIVFQIGKISFPLFLIHYPLLPFIQIFYQKFNLNIAILLYLIISILFSYIILQINDKLLNKLFQNKH